MLTKKGIRAAAEWRIARARLSLSSRSRFLRQMPKDGVCAEIGVFRGEFSREILRVTKPRELHLIDGWWLVEDEMFAEWQEHERVAILGSAHGEVDALAARHPECTVHVANDLDVLPTFPDGYFDWVYLDSSHEYEHTVEELEILRHKTGLISGHDWHEDTSHEHHGVCKAVVEFCDRYGWRLKAADPWGQWLVRSSGTG
jgi:Methyltransferase domain